LEDDDEDDDDDDLLPSLGFPDTPLSEDDGAGMSDDVHDEYDDEEDEDEEADMRPLPASSRARRGRVSPVSSSRGGRAPRKHRPVPPPSYSDDYSDEYDPRPIRRGSSSRSSSSSSRRRSSSSSSSSRRRSSSSSRAQGSVVPYVNKAQSTFTRGITAIKSSIPDPSSITSSAAAAIATAKSATTKVSRNIYREVKGLTSSELEQVMLKATRPDDTAVKGKHVERLVGVTYQISGRYDIYDSVLRKLWNKMAEADWRTTIKSLYVLHRFSADGAPEHQAALKARLRELRRTRDPKRKDKYFNSKQLLAGDTTPENAPFRAFMARYAHYVLLRAQCFGGMFNEISPTGTGSTTAPPAKSSSAKKSKHSSSSSAPKKPITSTALRAEHLEAATMLLKAGCACTLRDGEECENTAYMVERVAADMMGLTTAVAVALTAALKATSGGEDKGLDKALMKRWCEFYAEDLRPQVKAMVSETSRKLDKYGLFLPSRMGASVSRELLRKGMTLLEEEEETEKKVVEEGKDGETKEEGGGQMKEEKEKEQITAKDVEEETGSRSDDNVIDDEDDDEDEQEEDDEEDDDIVEEPKKRREAVPSAVEEEFDEYEYDEDYYDEEP